MSEERNLIEEIELIDQIGHAIDALAEYDAARIAGGDLDEETNAVIVITGQTLHRVMRYLTSQNANPYATPYSFRF